MSILYHLPISSAGLQAKHNVLAINKASELRYTQTHIQFFSLYMWEGNILCCQLLSLLAVKKLQKKCALM